MPPANPRPELGAHRYQGPFATSHDNQEVREHFLPVTSLFGIHLFLVHKNYYPSIIHFCFHNIHLIYYTILFVHLLVAITNFVLLDHCNIFVRFGIQICQLTNIYCLGRIVGLVVLLVYYLGCVDRSGSLSGSAFNQLRLVILNIVLTILY